MTGQNVVMASRARDLLLGTAHVERSRVLYWAALRAGVVTLILVFLALATGNETLALPVAVGAVFVAVADAGEDVGRRWRTMLWTTLWLMIAALLGGIGGDFVYFGLLGALVFAFFCGFAGALGPRAALIGTVTLVIYVVFNGAPDSDRLILDQFLAVGLGGFIMTLVVVLPHIFVRHAWAIAMTPVPSIRERLRGQSDLDNIFFRHAIRLTILIGITVIISDITTLPHDYWLPMTIAWVSRPDPNGTTSKILSRIAGTIVGVLIVWGLVDGLHIQEPGVILVSGIAGAVVTAMIWANYAVTVAGITVLVVTLFTFDGDPVGETLILRVLMTVGAGIIAFLGFYIFPPKRDADTAWSSGDAKKT